MGIDGNSRDLFSRIIYGSRLSLQIGVSTVTFAILLGGLLGAMAGFVGGWLDDVIMRSLDVFDGFSKPAAGDCDCFSTRPRVNQCFVGDRDC